MCALPFTDRRSRCRRRIHQSTSHSLYTAWIGRLACNATALCLCCVVLCCAVVQLLQDESDDNVKLIILGRLSALKKRNEKILQECLMDILRTLSTPNIEIRRKTLELAMELVSARSVDEVVLLLKKEIVKTESPEHGKMDDYRKLLVEAMHQCAIRFPEVVQTVVHSLMNYLSDENAAAGLEVAHFVREITEECASLREGIIQKMLETFDDIRTPEVYRVALWMLGTCSP